MPSSRSRTAKDGKVRALVSLSSASFATSHIIGRENKRTNNKSILLYIKNNGSADYQGADQFILVNGRTLRI